MDKPLKFVLPSPNFNKNAQQAWKPKLHYLTPSGMSLLPRDKQPPPMYGKQGATIPARYLKQHLKEQQFIEAPTSNPPERQYCEPCELELHSIEDLKRHQAQHEACPVVGCQYKGHPSVLDKHVMALHTSGLFEKFKKLSTPEEIAAWREERRKRYPTVANVLLKAKAKEQRQKRGERLEMNKHRFGKVNDRKRAQPYTRENTINEGQPNRINNKRSRKNKHKKKSRTKGLPKVQNEEKLKDGKFESEIEIHCSGIKMFTGTCQLTDYKHFNNNKKSAIQNVLFGLVGMYGSDDEESEENGTDNENHLENIETIITEGEAKLNSNILEEKALQQADYKEYIEKIGTEEVEQLIPYSNSNTPAPEKVSNSIINENYENNNTEHKDNSSDEAPEETPIQRSIPDYPLKSVNNPKPTSLDVEDSKCSKPIEESKKAKQKRHFKQKSGLDYRKARLRKQNTMLEKLLESDIRHERNVLLQCVRYVCENNFFNIHENKNQVRTENKLLKSH